MRIATIAAACVMLSACGGPQTSQANNAQANISNESRDANAAAASATTNDTAMLTEAHVGFLFRTPPNVKQQFPQFKAVEEYAEFLKVIRAAMA